MVGLHVGTLLHGGSRDRGAGRVVHRRLGVHALDRHNVSQRGIRRRLGELGRVARVVADEVEMLAIRGGDAERLLHQAVGLVSVSVGSFAVHVLVLVAAPSAVGGLAHGAPRGSGNELAPSALALHLAVGQEAARDAAGTP